MKTLLNQGKSMFANMISTELSTDIVGNFQALRPSLYTDRAPRFKMENIF